MKLDFRDEINEYGDQVVRLTNFDKTEAAKLKNAIQSVIIDANESLDLSTLDFIEPVNCRLILHVSEEDEGILTMDNSLFFCDLTIESYKNMIRLMEPFCVKDIRRSQSLYDLDTQIDFLFAPFADAE